MVERHPTLTAVSFASIATVCLAAAGWLQPLLACPPIATPASIPAWWYHTGALPATISVLRVVGVCAGAYLDVVLVVAGTARLTRRRRVQHFTTLLLPRPARSLLAVAAGICTVAHPAPASATPVARPAIRAHDPVAGIPEARLPPTRGPSPSADPYQASSSLPLSAMLPPPTLSPAGPVRPAPSRITSAPPRSRRPRRSERPRQLAAEWTVRSGQSFWTIAEAVVTSRAGGDPGRGSDDQEGATLVARYWAVLVAANLDRLPVPGNPDILYVGDQLRLPPLD